MDSKIKEGSLVVSNAGHDKGRVYLVLKVLENCVLCVDGEYRLIQSPKKKRLKHVKSYYSCYEDLIAKYKNGKLYDFEVKTILKNEVKMHKV